MVKSFSAVQPAKALDWILYSPEPAITSVRFVQFSKADSSILSTPSGITTLYKYSHS